ncbi:MAG TPA: hypothetical protein PLM79_02860 [Syntrophobacteraceae bacterium]|nr:hypothetical protein [Syntrophobacteraceae bacterium]
MRRDAAEDVFLTVGARKGFLPLVTGFVEQASLCLGLGREEALGLTLGAEEVFSHLCSVATSTSGPVDIRCSSGGYCVRTEFLLRTDAFDLRSFNLTASVSVENEADLDRLGLILASRTVDRLDLGRENPRELRLTLIKEKSYPCFREPVSAAAHPLTTYVLRPPTPEEVQFVSLLAGSYYDRHFLSDFLLSPGRLVDMIAVGEYQAVAAVGPAGEIGGAIFWHRTGARTVECFGPYVFNQPPESRMPQGLVEGCIATLARTRAVGLVSMHPTPQFPVGEFEPLGVLTSYAQDGSSLPLRAYFRLLEEDTGSAVWVHPELMEFVETECRRLVLPREIRPFHNVGETLPRHSVLSAAFDRTQSRAILRPLWPGADADENIAQHARLLREEGIRNIRFVLDLGVGWQAEFTPGLLRHGFRPCLLLPYAGEGDVVLFQLPGECP